jgi:hypothetical protein
VTEQEKSAPESSEILPDESGEADEAEESGEEEEADEDEETEE